MLPRGSFGEQLIELGLEPPAEEKSSLREVSGFQAIARAILKDAPILLLDEPTANLDALTEQEVLAALRRLMAGRSGLMITHRLAGLETAGEILVMQAGRIAERGRHGALLAMDGLYRRLWDLQNQALVVTE